MHNIFKKSLSLILATFMSVMSFTSINTLTVQAAAEQAEVYTVSFPRDGDANYGRQWGQDALFFMNGWTSGISQYTMVRAMGSYSGNIAYCIEPGVSQHSGDTLIKKDENFWDNYPSAYNHSIEPYEVKQLIGRIMQYGYTGPISTEWRSQNDGGQKLAHAVATQLLIWETVVGEREGEFGKVGTGGKDAILDFISNTHPLRSQILAYYKSIETDVQGHSLLPSFFNKLKNKVRTVELKWDGTRYSATLSDDNRVLSNYDFSANQNINITVTGNNLTLSADTAPKSAVLITANKKNAQRKGIITWTDKTTNPKSGIQDVVTYGQSVSDPIQGFLNLEVKTGSLKLIKTAEDGKVSGVRFTVTGNGTSQTATTNSKGEILLDNLQAGTYTITEQSIDRYKPQESRTVTIVSGQTASVTFSNSLKRGTLTVTKTAEDGLVEGIKFRLTGTSLSGIKVDEYAVTDKNGIAKFTDVLIGTGYVLSEVDTPNRYVVPANQTVNIEWNKVTNKSFHNTLKKFNVTVKKVDSETQSPQGNAQLAGAVYGIYNGEKLVDTYTTDTNGSFQTKDYVVGDNWTLREITPSEGYLLDTKTHKIGASAGNFTLEHNSLNMSVTEQVIKGNIAIIKHSDDGKTQIETPEDGAEFEVFLKSAGSYDKAKTSEKDLLVTDENGYALSKNLPYGIYTIRQTKGWVGRELMQPFEVNISQNSETYRYLINNANFYSHIKIVKTDADSGKVIPYAGAGFQLFDPAGKLIEMTVPYPKNTKISTFYSAEDGTLITPEALPYGKGYSLVEVQAPFGYVLDSTPIFFDVVHDNASSENELTIVKVDRPNKAQQGRITVSKTGEVFSSVGVIGGGTENTVLPTIYQPIYAQQGLAGALFEVIADEDIVTLDGTIHYKKGDIVDKITTEKDGKVASKNLPLGKYVLREVQAPFGMVKNNETHAVELVYAGQEVEITDAFAEINNSRQRVEILLVKAFENDEQFGITGDFTKVAFGLYTQEKLSAADGTTIPVDGLLELSHVGADGKLIFTTDVPVGAKLYVQECATDEQYRMDDTKYPVTFDYAGQDMAVVKLAIHDGKAIENKLIRGNVQGMKKDEDGNTLVGAVFGLFYPDETDFAENNAMLTSTSDENGKFGFENIPYGYYLVREITAPKGFVMSDDIFEITIAAHEQIVEIEAENTRIRGNVQGLKKDEDGNALAGAVFGLFYPDETDFTENKAILTSTSDENGKFGFKNIPYGKYLVREIMAPIGFVLSDEIFEITISEHGETIEIEAVNKPITGELELTKTDVATGKLLPNAGFRIKKEKGETVVEGYTNAQGIAKFTLRYGKYTYEEFDAPAGYLIDTTPHAFEITEDGQIVKALMTNMKKPTIPEKPTTPDNPKTGVNFNIALWLAIGGVGLACMITAVMLGKRRGKK